MGFVKRFNYLIFSLITDTCIDCFWFSSVRCESGSGLLGVVMNLLTVSVSIFLSVWAHLRQHRGDYVEFLKFDEKWVKLLSLTRFIFMSFHRCDSNNMTDLKTKLTTPHTACGRSHIEGSRSYFNSRSMMSVAHRGRGERPHAQRQQAPPPGGQPRRTECWRRRRQLRFGGPLSHLVRAAPRWAEHSYTHPTPTPRVTQEPAPRHCQCQLLSLSMKRPRGQSQCAKRVWLVMVFRVKCGMMMVVFVCCEVVWTN